MSATTPKVNGRLDHETEIALANGLALALAAFQGETPTFKKTKTATVQTRAGGTYTYHYADLGDILPVIGPLLAKHGLSWSSKVGRDAEGELVLRYRLLHVSGECDHDEMPLGVEKRCKPQELGSAITYARRYALTAQLNLATEEDDDGVITNGTGAEPAASQPSAAPKTTARPAERSTPDATGPQKGAINGRCNTAGLTENQRKAIFQWVGGTAVLDRIPKKAASALIERLGEDGEGAQEILLEISTQATAGVERAEAIVRRYSEAPHGS